MKFYVHCDCPELTMVIVWPDDLGGTVLLLKETALHNFLKKGQTELTSVDQFELMTSTGRYLKSSDPVKKRIKPQDDLFVKVVHQPAADQDHDESAGLASDLEKLHVQDVQRNSDKAVTKQRKARQSSPQSDRTDDIADMLQRAGEFRTKKYLRRAVLLYEYILRRDRKNKTIYSKIVDVYLEAGRGQRALDYANRASKLFPDDPETLHNLGRCHLAVGDGSACEEHLLRYCKLMRHHGGMSTPEKHSLQTMLGKAYKLKGENDMAITVLQGVLREDKTYVEALLEYAVLTYPLGPIQREEAVTIVLSSLLSQKGEKAAGEKFVSVCTQPGGMDCLSRLSGAAWEDMAALVYLATVFRDHGAITEAVSLLKKACALQPHNAHCLLTYVHTLEVEERHGEAVSDIQNFIGQFPEMHAGNVYCGMIGPVVAHLSDNIYLNNKERTFAPPTIENYSGEYTEEERYLLALLFTLVKILFMKGCLSIIPALTAILDTAYKDRNLHLTNVRNEAAYYSCISQVMKRFGSAHPNFPGDKPFLYFIGDSHCITPAWQAIRYQGSVHVLHPVLSTGTKIWHLREESTFYPKLNFYNAIRVIPKASTVILCFGEIDCREALLVCVEKCRYDSLEEAIETVVEFYIALLVRLQEQHQWTVFIHPVIPVLDFTREIVLKMNGELRRQIREEPTLHWLEFVNDLLTTDKTALKKEYEFDGTHADPAYLTLLEAAMDMCIHSAEKHC